MKLLEYLELVAKNNPSELSRMMVSFSIAPRVFTRGEEDYFWEYIVSFLDSYPDYLENLANLANKVVPDMGGIAGAEISLLMPNQYSTFGETFQSEQKQVTSIQPQTAPIEPEAVPTEGSGGTSTNQPPSWFNSVIAAASSLPTIISSWENRQATYQQKSEQDRAVFLAEQKETQFQQNLLTTVVIGSLVIVILVILLRNKSASK